ncbi:ABC transporter substrate-binding protein [Ornithinimicrobium faecis]|uniref:ABC transporter substrate-binding protein n=1 Tax=Ornithinimicrobium faecis TaxID=2934158 RepID=UPI0021187115|nr:ABC transporter substrate-binding protein [Ornithinimicrobium sp. HY1745]
MTSDDRGAAPQALRLKDNRAAPKRQRRLLVGAMAAATVAISGCGGGDAQSSNGAPGGSDGSTDAVTVRFASPSTVLGANTSPYSSLTEALGCAEAEGFNLEVTGVAGSAESVQAIEAGRFEMGGAGSAAVIAAAESGNLNSKIITWIISGNVEVIVVMPDSDIQSFSDFEGKTVGLAEIGSVLEGSVRAAMEAEGADPDTVSFVAPGIGAPSFVALERGDVDVVAMADFQVAQVEVAGGVELRPITSEYWDKLGGTMGMIASEDFLSEHPDIAAAVARCAHQSVQFATDNPEAAVRLHWEAIPDAKPVGPEDEALELDMRQVTQRMQNMGPLDGTWGAVTDEVLEQRIGDSDVEVSDIYTEEYKDEINTWDQDEMQSRWDEALSKFN